jgi:SPP1 family phage portal protein
MNILDIIKADIKRKEGKYPGRFYYSYKPKNINTENYYIKDGKEYSVKTKKTEVYINYFKMLVTQKIDYLLNKKPTYDKKLDTDGINIYTMLDKLLLNASLDSKAWLHVYVINNKLQYIIIKDNEIIPEYTEDRKELKSLIRYFKLDDILHVEIWSKDGVKRMTFNKDNQLLDEKVMSHYTEYYYQGDTLENTVYSNFESIPFICLENNKDVESDVDDIENLIVVYNGICTGFVDNVEKFQEALMVLRGYIGDKESIKKIMSDIQEAKGVSVPADGSLDYMKVDIPVEARSKLIEVLRDVIFLIGRGADPSKLGDGNITNVVIKSRYIELDSKSSDCIKRIIEFYDKLINFLNSFTNKGYDNSLEFNKSMLINESETIDDCLKSLNMISLETILKHHPFVDNVEDELIRIKAEKVIRDKEVNNENNDNNLDV